MTFWAKRFVNEAILRNKLERWGALYRLNDGKYYKSIVDTYNLRDAERHFKRTCGKMDGPWNEFEPSEYYKEMIKDNDYLYVYYIGKAED